MKRNGISETGWEVIWSRSANLEESDNIFVLSCQDDSILNKAMEEYSAYRDAHGLSDDDHEANEEYWRLHARGGEWRVEFANYNPRTGDFFPDSMQPPRLRQCKILVEATTRPQMGIDLNSTIVLAGEGYCHQSHNGSNDVRGSGRPRGHGGRGARRQPQGG